ncbi:LysR family transcriptional regulator [Streptomyces sp. NPDC057837]|uniref:helix-turn-helix domain-containing protein n=1 Tax=Streptomyces sp. NPDC057837 TaxID=3346260 RepID=UPI0036ADB15D
MTTTPKPITEDDAFRIEDRAPIGTRYTNEDGPVTLVAYEVDPHTRTARPLFIADEALTKKPSTHWYDRATVGSIPVYDISDVVGIGDPALNPTQPDPEQAILARAAFANRTEPTFLDTSVFSRVHLHDDLNSEEEVEAFLAYAKAELELREAQWKLDKAARERSAKIARMVDVKGSQQAAARALGLNQSTVSRALRERPERP